MVSHSFFIGLFIVVYHSVIIDFSPKNKQPNTASVWLFVEFYIVGLARPTLLVYCLRPPMVK
jgi:hypothetical protein